jgi:hypothetical protein
MSLTAMLRQLISRNRVEPNIHDISVRPPLRLLYSVILMMAQSQAMRWDVPAGTWGPFSTCEKLKFEAFFERRASFGVSVKTKAFLH